MENNQIGDLRISGSGSAGGGRYNVVSISGSGKIIGDLNCERFRISGSGKVDGSITTNDFGISGSGKVTRDLKCARGSISGSGKVEGSVYGGSFTISGSGVVEGNFKGDEFTINGSGKVGGRISGTAVKLYGAVSVGQGIEGEIIDIRGSLRTNNMVNGDQVSIEVGGRTEIEEIGATKVTVSKGIQGRGLVSRFFLKMFGGKDFDYLVAKTIEADEIYLENTIADVVRGGKIIIGEGCKIKKIEYSDSFEVKSETSIIDETIKL
ncbi:MAG: polymer-forming cytoskeletal protein [Clostridium sp.]|nr:polymer-forming cytoskeletal protein [Clostridium sp.]MDU7085463.1 polymer-forming cytoskeletal protein [Clostridium sp.]